MKKYDIFLLDADDTLFDFTACCKNALQRAMSACGFSYRDEYHLKYMEINDRLWRSLERKEITHERIFSVRFAELLTFMGESIEKAGELNEKYVDALSDECVIIEGAEEFLTQLNKWGRVYIITNGTASVQHGRFEKFRLKNYAEEIFISEEMGVYKPSKAYLDHVAARVPRFDATRALIIGDSLSSDISLANAAKVDCIWFNYFKKPFKGNAIPTYTAESYEEVLKIIGG